VRPTSFQCLVLSPPPLLHCVICSGAPFFPLSLRHSRLVTDMALIVRWPLVVTPSLCRALGLDCVFTASKSPDAGCGCAIHMFRGLPVARGWSSGRSSMSAILAQALIIRAVSFESSRVSASLLAPRFCYPLAWRPPEFAVVDLAVARHCRPFCPGFGLIDKFIILSPCSV